MLVRSFYPGSFWFYVKIYCSYRNIERLLINVLPIFIKNLNSLNIVEKWFFVRYEDSNPHLRLRIKLKSLTEFTAIFNIFTDIIGDELNDNGVWNVQIDTYQRELERYSPKDIDCIESIFNVDSISIINLLIMIDPMQEKEDYRWMIALLLIDSTFDAFSYTTNKRAYLLCQLRDSYYSEFGFTGKVDTTQLNDKYRKNRLNINALMSRDIILFKEYYTAIAERTRAISTLSKELKTDSLDTLLINLIHMTMNRLFVSKSRSNELVLYSMASKYYNSLKGRVKYEK